MSGRTPVRTISVLAVRRKSCSVQPKIPVASSSAALAFPKPENGVAWVRPVKTYSQLSILG